MNTGDMADAMLAERYADYAEAANGYHPAAPEWVDIPPAEPAAPKLEILSVDTLIERHPRLQAPLIDGLLRLGETANVVSAAKGNKTWLAMGAGVAVATGGDWLGFPTAQGRVLYIDNELHPATFGHRLRKVTGALGVELPALKGWLDVMSLRGRLCDIFRIGDRLMEVGAGHDSLVVVDALYRSLPDGFDENNNADIAKVYNAIDGYAASMDAAFLIVHHSSKGIQSGKSVTDVGSGAGSQSRACDAHIVLRPHEANDVAVMEAVTRSFSPVKPKCLRFVFPLFYPADDFNPAALRKDGRGKASGPTREAVEAFVVKFMSTIPKAKGVIEVEPASAGFTQRQVRDLFKLAVELDLAHLWTFGPKTPHQFATVPQPETEADGDADSASPNGIHDEDLDYE